MLSWIRFVVLLLRPPGCPGVRVLREPVVPPQWLAAFCPSALRSWPDPPVITRTLPDKPNAAQKLIWGHHWRQRRCFGLAVVFPISNYCLVCYAAAAGDAKWWREMPDSNHFPDEKSFRTLVCFPWPRLGISREYFEYYQTKVDGGRKSRCYPHGFLWDGPLLTFCPVVITEYGRKGKEGVCVSVRLVFVRWAEYLSYFKWAGKRQLAEVDVHLILRMPSKMRKTWNKLGRKNWRQLRVADVHLSQGQKTAGPCSVSTAYCIPSLQMWAVLCVFALPCMSACTTNAHVMSPPPVHIPSVG